MSRAARLAPTSVLCLVLLTACQSGAGVGTACVATSACQSPLVCRLGRCRNECVANRDCPVGSQCYLDPSGLGACQLDVDRSCGSESCGAGLTCLDTACVRACSMPRDCPVDGVCTIASGASIGVCSDARGGIDAGPGDAGTPIDASTSVDGGVLDTGGQHDASVDAASDVGVGDGGLACAPLDATEVCTGVGFSCAIRADTSVVCWGEDDGAILGVVPDAGPTCDTPGGTIPCAPRPIPVTLGDVGSAGLTTAVEIGCGADFACARLMSGRVRCWGRNYDAMLGSLADPATGAPEVVDVHGVAIEGITQIAVGVGHACALAPPSSVWCWGENGQMQLGHATASRDEVPAVGDSLAARGSVALLRVMSADTCIVHMGTTPELSCLGDNSEGQLGIDPSVQTVSGTLVVRDMLTLDSTAPVVSGGIAHVCALDASQHVLCWGLNQSGSLGLHTASTTNQLTPAGLYGPAHGIAFSALFDGATRSTNCAISASGLYCWGANGDGQAGQDPGSSMIDATRIDGIPAMVSGSCGQQHCCAVGADGLAWCWGANGMGQLGRGTTSLRDHVPAHVCAP